MGLFSFLRSSPEAQIEKANKLIANGEFARARNLVDGLEGDAAASTLKNALSGLRSINLQEAVALANAGEFERAEEHLTLAEEFGGGVDDELREARRVVRNKKASAPQKARRAPSGGGDMFGLGGGAMPSPPAGGDDGAVYEESGSTKQDGPESIWTLPPDDPRLAVAMAMESYPEQMRERLLDLGAPFISAVSLIDSGDPKAAVAALSEWIEREPAVRHERARAALNDGNIALAASDLASFGVEVGHQQVGQQHTAALLAQLLTQQGRLPEGIQTLEKALQSEPKNLQLRGTLAHLLELSGQIERADEVARALVRDHPKDMGLYKLMARCRIRGGKRMGAMQVLESGLKSNCTTGTCGAQPFDVEAGRMLAQLYLEDGLDIKRAEGLIRQVKGARDSVTWLDEYLEVLLLKNHGETPLTTQIEALLEGVPDGDPRRILVTRAFG
ncbi:MAG: tetratricopeptide repeat protein [Myxococcota bacterium]|nr:tetratricopeptide repeat protein [Myxococcota bacterium]